MYVSNCRMIESDRGIGWLSPYAVSEDKDTCFENMARAARVYWSIICPLGVSINGHKTRTRRSTCMEEAKLIAYDSIMEHCTGSEWKSKYRSDNL